jgi:hypothetical protein
MNDGRMLAVLVLVLLGVLMLWRYRTDWWVSPPPAPPASSLQRGGGQTRGEFITACKVGDVIAWDGRAWRCAGVRP